MPKGKVKWFDNKKGYGFIVPDDGKEDIFVHHSNVKMDGFRTLIEDQEVTYNLQPGKKGEEAVDVVPDVVEINS